MSARLWIAAASAALLFVGSFAPVSADDANTRDAVAKLFDAGWEPSFKARAIADDHFAEAARVAPNDWRVSYAYALVQIKQNRYPEAAKRIDDLLAGDKENVALWKAKIWLSMLTKNYPVALVEMDKLSQLVPADAAEGAAEEPHRDVARYLGRLLGFLEGPVDSAVSAATRDRTKRQILTRLGPAREAAFEEGRGRVSDQYAELTGAKEATAEAAKAAAEAEQQRLAAELKAKAEQITAKGEELDERREKLRAEGKAELDAIAKEDQPLLNELARLSSLATIPRQQLGLLSLEINRLQGLADREKDPVQRNFLINDINRLAILASRYDAELGALEARAAGVAAQRVNIQRRYQQAQASYTAQFGQIGSTLADLDKQQKRTEGEQQRNQRPTAGDTRRSRALAAQATAFTTYEEFPLEAERQRVLDLLR
jgi:hypothetical protein